MASTMVIKIKYGDTLRRFNARVIENNLLDLEMSGLRAKVFSLFNFPPDTDVTMTYVDEDGDVVTLVDDDDLRDAMRQQLKFLRIDVQIKNDKAGKSNDKSGKSNDKSGKSSDKSGKYSAKAGKSNAKASGSSTSSRSPEGPSPIPNFNAAAADVLKSLPEPFREFASKLPLDLASKAASTSPVLAELVDCFSKMGLSYLIPDSQVQVGGDSGTQSGSSKSPVAANLNELKDDGKSEPTSKPAFEESSSKKIQAMDSVNETKDVRMSAPPHHATVDLNCLPTDSNLSGPTAKNSVLVKTTSDDKKETKELPINLPSYQKKLLNRKSFGCGASTSSAVPAGHINGMSNNFFNECPFTATPVANDSATPPACRRIPFKRNHSEAMGGMFHTGVSCDGCGCHPIVGPRFKSVVKDNYDLCRICYSTMGNATDYIRIDHPVSYRHPRIFQGGLFHQPPYVVPPVLPKIFSGCSMKKGHPKLDSRFMLDVNVIDGTLIVPSTPFTKIWRMCNTGNLVWPQGTQLMWIGGDKFGKSDSVQIEIPAGGVLAGNELDIAADFTAPELPGRYISYWRMASPSGQEFGQRVWVLIQVVASLKDSFFGNLQSLNLNLPPEMCGSKELENIDVNQPAAGSDFFQPSGSSSVMQHEKLMRNKQPANDQELHFPINDSLLVGHSASAPTEPQNSSTVSYPTVAHTASAPTEPQGSSTVSYPTVDVFESAPPSPKSAPVVNAPSSSKGTSSINVVEDTLLKELEDMGFKQVNLNKEILRRNEYNLEQSVDELCDASEWDPILEELHEMGFCDTEINKKLLEKNNGSIKRVVMDLINGEKL